MRERVSEKVLEQWFQDLEDGTIGAEDHQSLMALLTTSAEVRRKFRRHMAFSSAMHTEAEVYARLHGFPERPIEKKHRKQLVRSWALAAAAVVVLLLVAGSMTIRRGPVEERRWMVAENGAIWSLVTGGVDPKEGILTGSEIQVDKGSLELWTMEGSRVVVEGPGHVVWTGERSLDLMGGQLWAEVAEGDHGFTVRAGEWKVVDLGTEFGVDLQAEGLEVHVQRGRVTIERSGGGPGREIAGGQAVRATMQEGIKAVACVPERFIRRLPVGPDFIRWSFEEVEPEGLKAKVRGWEGYEMHVLHPSGEEGDAVLTEGRFGRGVDLEASRGWLTSEFEGVLGAAPRTLALWVKFGPLKGWRRADGFPVNPVLVGWGEDVGLAKWNLVTSVRGAEVASVWGGSWVSSPLPQRKWMADGGWHHVASVFTGRHDEEGHPEIWHYLDGKKVEVKTRQVMGPVYTQSNRANPQGLHVGRVSGTSLGMELVPMKVDELVVVRRALSEGEIWALFQHNRVPGEDEEAE